jgi:hypothetical protein
MADRITVGAIFEKSGASRNLAPAAKSPMMPDIIVVNSNITKNAGMRILIANSMPPLISRATIKVVIAIKAA